MELIELGAIAAIVNGLVVQPIWFIWAIWNHYKVDTLHKGEKE